MQNYTDCLDRKQLISNVLKGSMLTKPSPSLWKHRRLIVCSSSADHQWCAGDWWVLRDHWTMAELSGIMIIVRWRNGSNYIIYPQIFSVVFQLFHSRGRRSMTKKCRDQGPVVFRCGLEIGRSRLTLTARPWQSGSLELPCLDWDNAKTLRQNSFSRCQL